MILLALLSACAPELTLEIPGQPLSGEVALVAGGDVDQLVLLADGDPIGGGPGPEVEILWDTSAVDPGDHWLRLQGYRGDRDPLEALWPVQVAAPVGDAPAVSFLAPEDQALFEENAIQIRLDVAADLALDRVWIEDSSDQGSGILADLPPEGPWVLLWEEVAIGWHDLRAVARDVDGQEGEAQISVYMAVDH